MPYLTGRIDAQHGAMIFIKVMQSQTYVESLKKENMPFSTPVSVPAILDTGASATAIDSQIISNLRLLFRDNIHIHTPSTGANMILRGQYDAAIVIGETEASPLTATIPVIESEFASRGFYALIGRDILDRCNLTYNGPRGTFTISW